MEYQTIIATIMTTIMATMTTIMRNMKKIQTHALPLFRTVGTVFGAVVPSSDISPVTGLYVV